ncbi:MAG: SMP-30/gluconolactonase/LRE family protein [Paracoccaceae bacterium]
MADAVKCLVPAGDKCGEGAVWSAGENAVYWTDINRFLIHRYDLSHASLKSWFFDEPVVAISLTSKSDQMLVALASKLINWWPGTDHRSDFGFALPGSPSVRFNDGRPDPMGNFWVGSMKNNVLPDGELGEAGPGQGVLYRVDTKGQVTEWRSGLGIANTLCWSPDRRSFYFADTLANEIYAYDYTDGAIGNERIHQKGFTRGAPDGSAIDSAGYLWNCRFGGGCILRLAPDGTVDRIIEMPVQNITTCTFGGPDLKTLFITTASIVSPPGNRLAGSLFSLQVETPGLPENRYLIA